MHDPGRRDRLEWLIIGGGPHGVHAAVRLIGEVGVSPRRLRILDPGSRLLQRWRHCTENAGMRFLRSPSVHHLDIEPASLQRFAGAAGKTISGAPFTAPYNRPSLALFREHCEEVLDLYGLHELHHRASARHIVARPDVVIVEDDGGATHHARRVVLALGAASRTAIPDWVRAAPHPRIRHIFDPEVRPEVKMKPSTCGEKIVIIGGGISAVQCALRFVDHGHKVHLVARHAPRVHQFDSDPGWLGPRYMNPYLREADPARRRAMIQGARHRGSIPPDLRRALARTIRAGQLEWQHASVRCVEHGPLRSIVHLESTNPPAERAPPPWLDADQIWLATGFHPGRPGGELIDRLIVEHELPCAACGYPIVDPLLRWHPRVVVTGPLAELELGPAARNISGARRAGERIAALAGQSASDLPVAVAL